MSVVRVCSGVHVVRSLLASSTQVTAMPPGFVLMASTASCPVAGMANDEKRWYGVQFHPEVTHTLQGRRILENFVLKICGCEALWTASNIVGDAIENVREMVRDDPTNPGPDLSFVDHPMFRIFQGQENPFVESVRIDSWWPAAESSPPMMR